jgi:hypothetical protein
MKQVKYLTILAAIFAQRYMADWQVLTALTCLIIALYVELTGNCILNLVKRAKSHESDQD